MSACPQCGMFPETRGRIHLGEGVLSRTEPCPDRIHDAAQMAQGLIPDNPQDLAAIARSLTASEPAKGPTAEQAASTAPPPDFGTGRPPKRRKWLLWCDLETGGLDPSLHPLMEAAFVLTDTDFREVWAHEMVFDASDFSKMDPKVREMHLGNGLIAACLQSRNLPRDLEHLVGRQIKDTCQQTWYASLEASDFAGLNRRTEVRHQMDDVYLAGSTVHFDRRWLSAHMPWIYSMLFYRQGDASSNYILLPRLASMVQEPPKAHRAMDDIRRSIRIAQGQRELVDFMIEFREQSANMRPDILRFAARMEESARLSDARTSESRDVLMKWILESTVAVKLEIAGERDARVLFTECLRLANFARQMASASIDLTVPFTWGTDAQS